MNAETCEDLVFQPVPGRAKGTEPISVPFATDVFYDGERLLLTVDRLHDYEYPTPDIEDFLLNSPAHHHLQTLAVMVCSIREDWAIAKVLNQLSLIGNMVTLPELAKTALTVATDPAYIAPESIRALAAGWYDHPSSQEPPC